MSGLTKKKKMDHIARDQHDELDKAIDVFLGNWIT